MINSIHIANSKGRDATVGIASVKAPPSPKMGVPGTKTEFRRYISSTEGTSHEGLAAKFGTDYAKELIATDPDIDMESVGQMVEQTQTVFLDGKGELMYADPKFLEIIINPDGSEKERRDPVDTESNVNLEVPVKWTGKNIPIKDAVRRFVFRRSLQLQHVDGLTYDYLFAMAKELEDAGVLMLAGTGEKGSGPLIFQANGRAYRGFLEGRTKDKSYCLMIHLSDMELKKPATKEKEEKES
jgi:hypothetical protein